MPKPSSSLPESDGPGARVAGWPELHEALKAGVPHAAEIVAALDLQGFSFPRPPAFNPNAELSCYRVVHRAWREGLLVRLLTVLDAWRTPGGQLPLAARRKELHQALCEFLETHRQIDPQRLRLCLAEHSLREIAPAEPELAVGTIRQRIEAAWVARDL